MHVLPNIIGLRRARLPFSLDVVEQPQVTAMGGPLTYIAFPRRHPWLYAIARSGTKENHCYENEGRDSIPSSSMMEELSSVMENRRFMIARKFVSVLIPTLLMEDHCHVTRG